MYTNEFKNWEFAEEAVSIFASGANGIAREHAVSEDKKFTPKLMLAKTNCWVYLCI